MRRFRFLIAVAASLAGCGGGTPATGTPAFDPAQAPTSKEALRYLLQNTDVPLTVDSSCDGVGTTPDDRTIGDYLSGFLAEQTSDSTQNWLEVTAVAASTPEGKPAWDTRVMVRRRDDEDVMGWGVGFLVTATDRKVVRTSFRCLGGG